ncbi:hypothetical protein F9288_16385 [Sphingomonas sp. CL5.1]|uniref:hypothetical protein n=1 Tax=Sphingomonas sp. CL5.1 TaxID=2653203 RepID=UPI0015815501|nr:hypothetical protein [Sphingomonas sp. CL5.1]QKS01027.1 hypothetical protein F9288_16385 [Sphingomonas sp. CL5.1]
MRAAVPILSLILLAACSGNPATPAANNTQAAAPGNVQDYAKAVAALPVGQQRGVFLRAIRDAGLPCQDVVDSTRFPDEHGVSSWRAECDDGSQQLIEIRKDGTATVVSRAGR